MKFNFKTYIFALLFAIVLWLYLTLNDSYSININFPLIVESGKNSAVSERLPDEIEMTLKGKGWDLLSLMMSKDKIYKLNLAKLKNDYKIITSQSLSERTSIPASITVLRTSPDTIDINLDKYGERMVKIKNNIVIKTKENYQMIGEPKFQPDSVKIRGAASLLNKIRFIPTEYKYFENVNGVVTGIINLQDTLSNLIRIEPRSVKYSFNVQLSGEKSFNDIIIQIPNVPSDKEVVLLPPKINISLRGGVDEISRLTLQDINVFINFSSIEEDSVGYVVPEIKLPIEANIIKMEPDKFQYILKKK
ncbi:hypothetical protein BH10BAC5_BH10BAC5_06410 [soil metagenome]